MFHAALPSLFCAIIVFLGPCVSRGKKAFALNGVMNRIHLEGVHFTAEV